MKAEYLDRDGKTDSLEADGLLATCLQHEIDHRTACCSSIICRG